MAQEPTPQQTVKDAVSNALGHLRNKYRDDLTPAQRDFSAKEFEHYSSFIETWLGDSELAPTAERALDVMHFADRKAAYQRELHKDPQALQRAIAKEPALAPIAHLLTAGGDVRGQGLELTGEQRVALARSGIAALPGMPDLADDQGNIRADVANESERSFFDFGAPEKLFLDDSAASLPSDFGSPAKMRERMMRMAILYGEKKQEPGQAPYVEFDGSKVALPDLARLGEIEVPIPGGGTTRVRVTPELQDEIQKSREGGIAPPIASAVSKWFHDSTIQTYYGQERVPNLTGNELVDRALMSDPRWQRATKDAPARSIMWWRAGKAALGLAEFAGLNVATGFLGRGAGAVLGKAAGALKGVSPLGARIGGAMSNALLEGGRVASRTRVPGVYFDARQIGENIWYHAVSGSLGGEWEPGKWFSEGWNEGVSQYVAGRVARATRVLGREALRTFGGPAARKWVEKITDPEHASIVGAGVAAAERAGASTKAEIVADLTRRAMLREAGGYVNREMVGSLYDTSFVGYSLGAWTAAHRIAAENGRKEPTIADFIAGLDEPEAAASALGMVAAHAMMVGGGALNRIRKDRERVAGQPFLLNSDETQGISGIAQVLADAARSTLSDPTVAAAQMEGFTKLGGGAKMRRHIEEAKDLLRLQALSKGHEPQTVLQPEPEPSTLDVLVQEHADNPLGVAGALRAETPEGLAAIEASLANVDPRTAKPATLEATRGIRSMLEGELDRRANEGDEPTPPPPETSTEGRVWKRVKDAQKEEAQARAVKRAEEVSPTPKVAPTPKPKPTAPPSATMPSLREGFTSRVKFAAAERAPLPVTYGLAEASDLIPSHDARRGFKPNEGGDINQRAYDDPIEGKLEREKVAKIAAELDPDDHLSNAPYAVSGAPVVTRGGRVLGGNARTMGVQLAYSEDTPQAHALREAIVDRAKQFGLDASGMKEPVLVRVVEDADVGAPGELSRLLNEAPGQRQTAVADAADRGRRITGEGARMIAEAIGEGTLAEALNSDSGTRTVLAAMRRSGAFTEGDVVGLMEPGERFRFTKSGKDIVEQTLLSAMIPDTTTRSLLQSEAPSLIPKLTRALPGMVRLQQVPELEMGTVLAHAVDAVVFTRQSDQPSIKGGLRQPSIDPQPWKQDARAIRMAELLWEETPTNFGKKMIEAARAVDEAARGQVDMFLGRAPTVGEAFDLTLDVKPVPDWVAVPGPTQEQITDAHSRTLEALAIEPDHAHLSDDPAAQVGGWFEQADYSSPAKLEARTREAEVKGAEFRETIPEAKKLSPDMPAEIPPPKELPAEDAQVLWSSGREPAVILGQSVFAPGNVPLSSAKQRGAQAVFDVTGIALHDQVALRFGTPEQRIGAQSRLESLAVGALLGSGLHEGSHGLIAGMTGLPIEQVQGLAARLEAAGRPLDAHIAAVLATWFKHLGKPLFTFDQLQRTGLRNALRAIALGAPIVSRQSSDVILAGRSRSEVLARPVDAWVSVASKAAQELKTIATAGDVNTVARYHAEGLHRAVEALPAGGLRVSDIARRLRDSITYSQLGKRYAAKGDEIAGKSVHEIALEVMESLSQKKAETTPEHSARAQAFAGGEEQIPAVERVGVSPLEAERRSGQGTGLGQAKRMEVALSGLRRLITEGNLDELRAPDGTELTPSTMHADERAATRASVLLGLLHDDQDTIAVLESEQNWGPGETTRMRERTREVQGLLQEAVREQYRLDQGPEGAAFIDATTRVMEAVAKGRDPAPVDVEALAQAGLWNRTTKRLEPRVYRELTESAARSIALTMRASAAETGLDPELREQAELRSKGLEGTRGVELLFGGIPAEPGELRTMALMAADFATGYYDRALSHPYRHAYEALSARGKLSFGRVMDRLAEQGNIGPIQSVLADYVLATWQRYVGRGARGLGTSEVRARNRQIQRARLSGHAKANRLLFHASALTKRIVDMGLNGPDRSLIGQVIHAGGGREIHSQALWEAAFPGKGHLWEPFVEVNDLMLQLGHQLVDEGILDPKAREQLENRYLPGRFKEIVWGAGGPLFASPQIGVPGARLGTFEQARSGTQARRGRVRIFDVAYVLPTAMVEVSQRLRLFHSLNEMRDRGAIITRAEYDKLTPWEKAQYVRVASAGKIGEGAVPAITTQEARELPPSERERELEERRRATLEQTLAFEFIQQEREAHTELREGKRHATLTPRARKLLFELEEGYTTIHGSQEIALLIDQTELGSSINTTPLGDFIQRTNVMWRSLRTVYNPRHWVLQLASNWATNAMTGKVPLHDILDPNGSYAQSQREIVSWDDWVKSGKPEDGRTPEISEMESFAEKWGGDAWVRLMFGPVTARDMLADISQQTGAMRAIVKPTPHSSSSALMHGFAFHALATPQRMEPFGQKFDTLMGSANPEMRAEAQRAMGGVYALQEMFWKYAAYKEGRKLGLEPQEAFEWAAEGTGDFSDRNTWLLLQSTQFSASHGATYGRARTRLGKPERIGEVEAVLKTGLGGPFWMYKLSMLPTLARSIVNHPHKSMVGMAAMTFLIQAISTAFGGEDEDLRAADAGRGTFLHENLRAEDIDILAQRYGGAHVSPINGLRITYRNWAKYWKAFVENTAHAATMGLVGRERPEAAMLLTAQGPSVGGDETKLAFGDFVPLLSFLQGGADRINHFGEARPAEAGPSGASEIGVGFLPSMVASAIAAGIEMARGVEGKSRERVIGEHMAHYASAWSTPLAGLPWLASMQGQTAIGEFAWDGRSVGEMIDSVPSARGPTSGMRQLAGVAAQTLLPTRRVSNVDVLPRPDGGLLESFGFAPQSPPPANEPDSEGAERGKSMRRAIGNVLSAAYKNASEHGGPTAMWYGHALDLERDLVMHADATGQELVDVVEHPQTALGQFIREQGDTPEERTAWVRTAAATLKLHRADLIALADNPEGLAYMRWLPAPIHERVVQAVMDKTERPDKLLQLFFTVTHNEGARKGWAGQHDGTWVRLWHDLDMDAYVRSLRSGSGRDRGDRVSRWMRAHSIANPTDYDSRPVSSSEMREALGPRVYDVAPNVGNAPFQKLLGGQ